MFLSSSLSRSQVIVVAYIRMKVFHWSAVNPENPSPVAILFGILPISDGTFILLARSCMISKCFVVNRFSSIHNRVTIHLAIPKNRQCIGSTIRNFVGSSTEADISLTNEQRSQRHDFFVHLQYYIPSIYMHYFLFHQHLSLQTIDSYHQIHQNLTDSCHKILLLFHINDKRHEPI